MRTVLKVASILSWFNLLWWGLNLLSSLPTMLAIGAPMLAFFVVLASIPLNSYAALQLHKSIRRSDVKLSSQTPVGIRFVGLAAQLCGFILIILGAFVLLNTAQMLAIFKDPATIKDSSMNILLNNPRGLRFLGAFMLFLGLCVSVNVVLNFRLLRWYYLVRQSDVTGSGNSDATGSGNGPV